MQLQSLTIQLRDHLDYILLGILFFINAALFWPGQMTSDSIMQYQAAISGLYFDWHPPIMSVLWRFFNYLYPGPGLLFLFHLSLFYISAALLITIFRQSKFRWFYVILPLIPPLSLYSSMLWKDIAFTFSYLCVATLISFFIVKQKKPSFIIRLLILCLLFYGTGAKFQAMYILPVLLLGFFYTNNNRLNIKTFLFTIIGSIFFFYALTIFNDYFVPTERKGHGWQLVKLYDLAAISLDTHKLLFPEFILKNPNFSVPRLQETFNYELANDLVSIQNAPLIVGANAEQRQLVLDFWSHAVLNMPKSYLKHRFTLWFTMLNNHPIKKLDTLDFSQYAGLKWFVTFQQPLTENNTFLDTMRFACGKVLRAILWLIRFPLKTIFIVPFLLFYFLLGLFKIRINQRYALPLVIMSGAGLLLLIILIFFSMASTIRYVFFTICMFHACHGFAYRCWKSKKLTCKPFTQ